MNRVYVGHIPPKELTEKVRGLVEQGVRLTSAEVSTTPEGYLEVLLPDLAPGDLWRVVRALDGFGIEPEGWEPPWIGDKTLQLRPYPHSLARLADLYAAWTERVAPYAFPDAGRKAMLDALDQAYNPALLEKGGRK